MMVLGCLLLVCVGVRLTKFAAAAFAAVVSKEGQVELTIDVLAAANAKQRIGVPCCPLLQLSL